MLRTEDIKDFFESERPEYTSTGKALREIAVHWGKEIFLKREALEAEMRKAHIPEMKIMQIRLMISVSGFPEMIWEEGEGTEESRLNRFIGNAQEETGLSRETVLALGADISAALGYPVVTEHGIYERALDSHKSFVVPFSFYEKELKVIRNKLKRQKDLTSEELKSLTTLTQAEIPEAQMYMSEYLKEWNPEKAEELLLQAAKQGWGEAQAKLGDLYYEKAKGSSWEEAYNCYTGYGTIALDQKRRSNLKDILNQRLFNIRVLRAGAVIMAAMVLLTVYQATETLYRIRPAWSLLFLLGAAGIWVAAAVRYKGHPFAFFNWLIPWMSLLLGIYLLIWLL